MLNRVVLIGRLTKDPELRYTPNGKAVCSFTLAVAREFGERGSADFFDIVVWGKPGEACANNLSKSRLVAVVGRLQIRSYETNDGQKRKATEIVAETVKFLDKGQGANGGQRRDNDEWSDIGREVGAGQGLGDDDEIPF